MFKSSFKPKLKTLNPATNYTHFQQQLIECRVSTCPYLSFADTRSISSLVLMNLFYVNQFNMLTVPCSSSVKFVVQQSCGTFIW